MKVSTALLQPYEQEKEGREERCVQRHTSADRNVGWQSTAVLGLYAPLHKVVVIFLALLCVEGLGLLQ